jgi:hypothetical protein
MLGLTASRDLDFPSLPLLISLRPGMRDGDSPGVGPEVFAADSGLFRAPQASPWSIFKEVGWGWTFTVILILLCIGVYLVYSEWSSTRTAVTVLSLEKKVVICDTQGKIAQLERQHKIRVNQG